MATESLTQGLAHLMLLKKDFQSTIYQMKMLVLPAGYYVIDCRVYLIKYVYIYMHDGSDSVGQ